MSKIKLTGSNSGYVEIDSAADAGNLTLQLPTAGTALLSNAGNVFSGITTTGQLDINGSVDVSSTSVFNDDLTLTGASYNVVWDKSDNQLEFGNNAKLSFGSSSDLQVSFDSANSLIAMNTGSLSIINYANNEDVKILSDNGAGGVANYIIADGGTGEVLLHHYGNEKIKTTNTGVTVTGTVAATSYTGDGSQLTNVGFSTEALTTAGATVTLDLSKDDHKITKSGTYTITCTGGSEGSSHTVRIVNSGTSNVSFSNYFLFPSGGTPALPTASGGISMISFTVHRAGAVGINTQLLAGASVNFS